MSSDFWKDCINIEIKLQTSTGFWQIKVFKPFGMRSFICPQTEAVFLLFRPQKLIIALWSYEGCGIINVMSSIYVFAYKKWQFNWSYDNPIPHSWILEHDSNIDNTHIIFSFQTTPSLLEGLMAAAAWTQLKQLVRIPPPQYWTAWRIWATSQEQWMVLWEQHLVCIGDLSKNIIFRKYGNYLFNF